MITKEETKTLKEHLKTNYIKDVLKELESKQITSKSGEPFSDTYISAVLNGRKENLDIEDAIFMVYQKAEKGLKTQKQEFKRIVRKGFTVIEWGGSELPNNYTTFVK